MNFPTAVKTCLVQKYASFSGRASRSEFWWFYLFTILVGWTMQFLGMFILGENSAGLDIISSVANLIFILPTFAVGCRRLHDIGRSGWWQLLLLTVIGVLLLIYWWIKKPVEEDNKYGELESLEGKAAVFE
jgi:uncharacterized membrane protein YhaH (DUF805 family)